MITTTTPTVSRLHPATLYPAKHERRCLNSIPPVPCPYTSYAPPGQPWATLNFAHTANTSYKPLNTHVVQETYLGVQGGSLRVPRTFRRYAGGALSFEIYESVHVKLSICVRIAAPRGPYVDGSGSVPSPYAPCHAGASHYLAQHAISEVTRQTTQPKRSCHCAPT
ncbi:hypothetical protein E2C01_036771 [Portunus trituberculatus]|uniref:Uncharacterized protein n=1 Tax=Portunus trituberculatus TaxID=210409 RepID=A0A5B7FF86_PORTR|nr:hypothetical protein [Portunus trituberculatus]